MFPFHLGALLGCRSANLCTGTAIKKLTERCKRKETEGRREREREIQKEEGDCVFVEEKAQGRRRKSGRGKRAISLLMPC